MAGSYDPTLQTILYRLAQTFPQWVNIGKQESADHVRNNGDRG